jgi:spermidine dehydrogenase
MKDHRGKKTTLGPQITRRDFMGAALIGAGVGLLHSPAPAAAPQPGRSWTGYGGVGDYRFSNGNTAAVVDTGEVYDLLVVGAGFYGMSAIYEFSKSRPRGSCLMMDNHAIFGGEAKQNEFDVDGYRLTGPQGPNSFSVPTSPDNVYYDYWREFDMPTRFDLVKREGGDPSIIFAQDNFSAMYWAESTATVGYYFQNSATGSKGRWVKDMWRDDLERAPLPEDVKRICWPGARTMRADLATTPIPYGSTA